MLLRHVTCVGIIASLCRDQRLSPAITAAAQNSQHPIFVCCSASADRRVTDNNVITVCCYNRYNHIIFRVQTHNVCRNQQTTVAVIIGCTRRHVSTWRYTAHWVMKLLELGSVAVVRITPCKYPHQGRTFYNGNVQTSGPQTTDISDPPEKVKSVQISIW